MKRNGAVPVEKFAHFSVFEGLDAAELSALSDVFQLRSFRCKDALLLAGHTSDVVYVVLEGTVKVALESDRDGVTVTLCGPGDVLGDMSVIDGLGHSASVIATEACLCAYLSAGDFRHLAASMPRFTWNLYRSTVGRLRLATTRIHSLAAHGAQGKVAHQLLVFAQKYALSCQTPVCIPLRLTQSEIGTMVGATRVSVNKALMVFVEKGYISYDHQHRITVHDLDGLRRHCC